jgi:hypothetical protein
VREELSSNFGFLGGCWGITSITTPHYSEHHEQAQDGNGADHSYRKP